jgi:hypothetical protein
MENYITSVLITVFVVFTLISWKVSKALEAPEDKCQKN